MTLVLFLSDVVSAPVIKEIRDASGNRFLFTAAYEEDLVLKLLSLQAEELDKYDLLFVHSDQVFHQKDRGWQKTYFQALAGVCRLSRKYVLVSNACSPSFYAAPLKSSFGNIADTAFLYREEIGQLLQCSNVYIFDFLGLCLKTGTQNFYNYNLGHLYQMPYSKQGVRQIALEFIDEVQFLSSAEKKVIIADCDNTLWKGIIGEDGINGIVCDKNAEGILHYSLQRFLKIKREEGFLLCICSKNNEYEVREAFEMKSFPLKWSDFIVKKINWEDKIVNIREIAGELNLGLDSFIFIDDNLFELNAVTGLLHGVSCVHFPAQYDELLTIFNSFLFRKRQILAEDLEKNARYEAELVRKDARCSFTSIDDFIVSLDIVMDIRTNDTPDFPRLSQMTRKINQFNLNKKTYDEDELYAFTEKGRVYSVKVSDKYGDYGTVGLIMVEINGTTAILENYLVSCRALGRQIEFRFYKEVLARLSAEGIEVVEIRFKQNDHNIPAQNFIKYISNASNTN